MYLYSTTSFVDLQFDQDIFLSGKGVFFFFSLSDCKSLWQSVHAVSPCGVEPEWKQDWCDLADATSVPSKTDGLLDQSLIT